MDNREEFETLMQIAGVDKSDPTWAASVIVWDEATKVALSRSQAAPRITWTDHDRFLFEAACECMSPDQVTVFEQAIADDDLRRRFANCVRKRFSQDVARVAEPVTYDGVVSICDAHGINLPPFCIEMVVEIIGHACDPQPPQAGAKRGDWQQKALDYGFQYWRASDSHGVEGTKAQAVELLQDLLGVEVEIKDNGCQTCDGSGQIGGPSYYAPDEGGVPCPDCSAPAAPAVAHHEAEFEADAKRLALELECIMLDCKDTAVSAKWWDSGMEALEQHRKLLADTEALAPFPLEQQPDWIRNALPPAAPAPAEPKGEQQRAKPISDEMMDLVDRLGSEAAQVDPRAWEHLLVYTPKPEQRAATLSDDVRQVLLDLTTSWGILKGNPCEQDKAHAEHLLAKAIKNSCALIAAHNGGKHAD
jgi:hypothetical protein